MSAIVRRYVTLLAVSVLLLALSSACGDKESPAKTGAPVLTNPRSVPTATPWPAPPTPIFVDGTPRPTGTPTPTPGTRTTYTVQPGDSPASIASRFGVDVQELMRVNNITDPTRLAVGQVLIMPAARTSPSPTPTPRPGSPAPAASPRPSPTPAACADTYIVQAGDYPGLIAQKCGVDVTELMQLNGITDPTSLRVGQELRIPRRR